MTAYLQTGRTLSVSTALGDDVLLLSSFTGREEMSRLFLYDLELLSTDDAVNPEAVVGKPITFGVMPSEGEPRYFNGIVSRFSAGGRGNRGLRSYRAEVAPWLWFLTQNADCRIFQHQTAPEIVKKIFDELGFTDYQFNLRGDYAQRDYCVQYRESSFKFVSRLLEEEGIAYCFRHENGTQLVGGTKKTTVTGSVLETYNSALSTVVKSGVMLTSTGANIDIVAATQVMLNSGASTITLKADGTIEITGVNIKINGKSLIEQCAPNLGIFGGSEVLMGVDAQAVKCDGGAVTVSGAEINASAEGTHNIEGALVKIN
jgi:hypothetical protein